jgi:hypothetical protein
MAQGNIMADYLAGTCLKSKGHSEKFTKECTWTLSIADNVGKKNHHSYLWTNYNTMLGQALSITTIYNSTNTIIQFILTKLFPTIHSIGNTDILVQIAGCQDFKRYIIY